MTYSRTVRSSPWKIRQWFSADLGYFCSAKPWVSGPKYTVYVYVCGGPGEIGERARTYIKAEDERLEQRHREKGDGWRKKRKASRPERRWGIEGKSPQREWMLCFSDKERTGYKPEQSGQLGHMFPITSDWHQTQNTGRPQAGRACKPVIDSYSSPLLGLTLFLPLPRAWPHPAPSFFFIPLLSLPAFRLSN